MAPRRNMARKPRQVQDAPKRVGGDEQSPNSMKEDENSEDENSDDDEDWEEDDPPLKEPSNEGKHGIQIWVLK